MEMFPQYYPWVLRMCMFLCGILVCNGLTRDVLVHRIFSWHGKWNEMLVGGLEHFDESLFYVFHIWGMSSSQLTFIFSRGVAKNHQPERICPMIVTSMGMGHPKPIPFSGGMNIHLPLIWDSPEVLTCFDLNNKWEVQ